MTLRIAHHEAAHVVAALALGVPVRAAALAPAGCTMLADAAALAQSAAGLRVSALIAAAGPSADLVFTPGDDLRGYASTDPHRSDLAKVAFLALASWRLFGRTFDVREVLRESARLVLRHREMVAEVALQLAKSYELDAAALEPFAVRLSVPRWESSKVERPPGRSRGGCAGLCA